SLPEGTRVMLAGRVTLPNPVENLSGVLVNGVAVDALDATGRFFKSIEIGPGQNTFDITALSRCGEVSTTLLLNGITPQDSAFEGLTDVSAQLMDEYADTTFNRTASALVVDARARNIGDTPVDGAVLMAIGPQLNPSVAPTNRHGRTMEGEPYYVMLGDGMSLDPSLAGPFTPLVFNNPDRVPVRYDVRWLALGNRAPLFTTAPTTTIGAGMTYQYAARAEDPDGQTILYALESGPEGMTLDPATGDVQWITQVGDIGGHDVTIAALDGRGGRAAQRFTLSVVEALANRPPFFTSAPVTQSPIGAPYAYDADAVDLDDDPLMYALTDGPVDMVIDPVTGEVSWPFPCGADVRIGRRRGFVESE
ncbi:MAG: Ig domain-containing protein, partial [Phycisphaerae bacterium]